MKDTLLEYIYERSELSYISDLRLSYNIAELMTFIETIDESMFEIYDWKLFVSYIFGEQIDIQSIEEAIQLLKLFSMQ